MEIFAEYLEHIENPQHRNRLQEIFSWIAKKYPDLTPKIAWNQPMFTDHGTFIIGFSTAKNHMSVSPERAGIEHFSEEIMQAGYAHSKQLVRIPWEHPVDFQLLGRMIEYNILDKAECPAFWRK